MNQVIYSSALFTIGRFTISPEIEDFYQKDLIQQPTIVFPKNSIWIKYENSPEFVADTSIINFYNHNQHYTRKTIDPNGDDCHWLKPSPELLSELFPEGYKNEYESIFNHQNIPCKKHVFLKQIKLLSLIATPHPNKLLIEETALELLHEILHNHLINKNITTPKIKNKNHKILVEKVKSTILENLSKNITLKQLARVNASSSYHLSRVFKSVSGLGINQYRTKQRLRNIVIAMQNGSDDLAYLAMDYGFSSHSHLTQSFKKYFNQTPSQLSLKRYF